MKVGEVKSEINETLLRQEAARHLVATGRKVTGDLQDKGAGDPNPWHGKVERCPASASNLVEMPKVSQSQLITQSLCYHFHHFHNFQ